MMVVMTQQAERDQRLHEDELRRLDKQKKQQQETKEWLEMQRKDKEMAKRREEVRW